MKTLSDEWKRRDKEREILVQKKVRAVGGMCYTGTCCHLVRWQMLCWRHDVQGAGRHLPTVRLVRLSPPPAHWIDFDLC